MNTSKVDHALIQGVLDRLADRQKLLATAREMLDGIKQARLASLDGFDLLAGELEEGTCCQGKGNAQTVFYCDKGGEFPFNCQQVLGHQFDCHTSYSACSNDPGLLGGHSCDDNMGFTCRGSDDTIGQIFDCFTYFCGKRDGNAHSFHCTAQLDFNCDSSFICIDSFECSADHIFWCTRSFLCEKNFSCKAGTSPNPTPCSKDYPYDWPPPIDSDPGDFVCGHPGPLGDNFACMKIFKCLAKDDFRCVKTAGFHCGEIDPGTEFSCPARFYCAPPEGDLGGVYCLPEAIYSDPPVVDPPSP